MVIDTSNPIIWKAKADVSEFKASLAYSTECVPAGATQRSPGWKEWKKKKKKRTLCGCLLAWTMRVN